MKKLLSGMLALTLIFSLFVPTALAVESPTDEIMDIPPVANEATEEAIDQLVEELVHLRMDTWMDQQLQKSGVVIDSEARGSAEVVSTEERILNEIENLGARKVGYEYVHRLNSNLTSLSGVAPAFFEGWNEEYDDFYATGPYNKTVNGTKYYYVLLRVVPRNDNSRLSDADIKTVAVQSSRSPLKNFVRDTISIYAQKTLGQVPVVSWLPYEYLFSDWSDSDIDNTNASYVINVNSATTAKYVYVTTENPNDEYSYTLALLDHSVSVAESHVSSWTKNGQAGQTLYPSNGDYYKRTVNGNYYSSPANQAISNYQINWYEMCTPPVIKFYKNDGQDILKSITPSGGIYNPDFW